MAAYATTDLLLDSLAPSTPLRPILTRLNADNSWMMSLPRPGGPDASGKAYYHVLQDLWLGGSLTEWPYTAFLFKIVRTQAGQFDDVADIERLVASLEAAAAGGGAERAADATTTTKQRQGVDAILVSHTNIDHCHRATLERFPRETPVLVVADAAALAYSGVISWLLRFRGWTFEEGVAEMERRGGKMDAVPAFFDIENGGALVLV
ncbi:40S ribosomal protein S8 [Verticillium dahliae VDG2]|nr:40S ribosomal protein S8 [Verticillium dahliae VDG2]